MDGQGARGVTDGQGTLGTTDGQGAAGARRTGRAHGARATGQDGKRNADGTGRDRTDGDTRRDKRGATRRDSRDDGMGRDNRDDGTGQDSRGRRDGTAGASGRDGTAGAMRQQGRRDGTAGATGQQGRRDSRGDGTGGDSKGDGMGRDSRGNATAGATGWDSRGDETGRDSRGNATQAQQALGRWWAAAKAAGTRATGATGTQATGATCTRATGVTGSAARRATGANDSWATGATGSFATEAVGFTAATPLQPPPFSQNPPSCPRHPYRHSHVSPTLSPAPYNAVTESVTKRRELKTRASTPEHHEPKTRSSVPTRVRRVRRPCAPAVPGTHDMALRPSSVPQRVVLPSPPASSLPNVADPLSDLARASSPTVTCLLATVVTDPTFSSPSAFALVIELVDFVAAHCLDNLASLVSDPNPAYPLSVGGEVALGCDVVEDRHKELECLAAAAPHLAAMLLAPEGDPDALDIPTPRSYREVISGEYTSQWQIAMDAEMASWKSTSTYVDEVPPLGANIVNDIWIFRVKRPPGSPPAFKTRYVARGFIQRQGVDFFQTFSPTLKMTTLRVLLHVAAQRDCELHSLDFSTAFLQGSLHEAIWLHRPPGFSGSFPEGIHWSLRRPVYGLRQAPCEWHDPLRMTLAALGFAPSTADPSLFLRTDTSLPPFYVLVYVEDLVFATSDIEVLILVKAELQERHTCTDLGELQSYLGLQITRDRARRTITLTQSHMVHQVLQRFGFQHSLPQPTPLSTSHSLSAPPSDKSIEPSGPYPELLGCLMYLMC
ncbi:unnamed protein product [Closterium sp. NIES-54]